MSLDPTLLSSLLAPVVDRVARARGLDLEGLSVHRAGRRRRLVVVVDRDGGVTLDECADLARELSSVLDATDAAGPLADESYVLEVGSPGLDRPLTAPRHWQRSTGRLVRVVDSSGRAVIGRVVRAGEQAARIAVDGDTRDVPYASVASARVQVEFGRETASGTASEPGRE